ncbi:hypothetical protein [Actinoalloteichus hymeniacidonis]|nr:hypothetical protein [Actinoalloteichus hymeniacidonis]MBB5905887.1 hypothetical protein [Actinoalloteichus hymeniacidonis]
MLAKTLIAGAIVVAPVLAATPAMAGEYDKGDNGHGHGQNDESFKIEIGEWNNYKVYSDLEVSIDFKTGYEVDGGSFEFATIKF